GRFSNPHLEVFGQGPSKKKAELNAAFRIMKHLIGEGLLSIPEKTMIRLTELFDIEEKPLLASPFPEATPLPVFTSPPFSPDLSIGVDVFAYRVSFPQLPPVIPPHDWDYTAPLPWVGFTC